MKIPMTSPAGRTIGAPDRAQPALPKESVGDERASEGLLSAQAARRVLISLMFPSIMMPLTSSMSRVALPLIRDDFQISADMTAWVVTAFTLPFMVLMPVYGRLSDGVGRRRLILAGISIFSLGTAITLFSTDLATLMLGRALQGIGASGIMPLSMALISTIFPARERGKALGTWSSVGPTVAFFGPLLAGLIVAMWDWRAAFAPPLLAGIVAFFVVGKYVPPGLSNVQPKFLRSFDWAGVGLLAVAICGFIFYLSSRPITGVMPLLDWRLLITSVAFMAAFIWWEKRRVNPFVDLTIFASSTFNRASICASLRMFSMAGVGFLVPLYLVDIHNLNAAQMGVMLIINPGAMAVMVRFGGTLADRWGSRWPVVIGLAGQTLIALMFYKLPADASLWTIGGVLALQGLAVGLMLAALHRSAMGGATAKEMGAAAGIYSMIRFAGMAIGTALAGALLQRFLDQSLPTLVAYQSVFLFFAIVTVSGIFVGFGLREHPAATA